MTAGDSAGLGPADLLALARLDDDGAPPAAPRDERHRPARPAGTTEMTAARPAREAP